MKITEIKFKKWVGPNVYRDRIIFTTSNLSTSLSIIKEDFSEGYRVFIEGNNNKGTTKQFKTKSAAEKYAISYMKK